MLRSVAFVLHSGAPPLSDAEYIQSLERLARSLSPQMMEILGMIARDGGAKNSDRIAAAKEIMDRGHGKPTQAVIAIPSKRAIAQQLAGMTDDQLMETLTDARARRASLPALVDSRPDDEAELDGDDTAADSGFHEPPDPWE